MENPKIHKQAIAFGNVNLYLEGEQFKGLPILDTRVIIGDITLCHISWKDKDKFANELNDVINKYQI